MLPLRPFARQPFVADSSFRAIRQLNVARPHQVEARHVLVPPQVRAVAKAREKVRTIERAGLATAGRAVTARGGEPVPGREDGRDVVGDVGDKVTL